MSRVQTARRLPVLAMAAFAGTAALAEPMVLPLDPVPLVFVRGGDPVATISVEVADEVHERMRGLMERPPLPDDRGMLFVFEETRIVTMWMRDTPSSLDMVFISENGEVKRIAEATEPLSDAIITSGSPVRHVLEVRAGLANDLGIAVGDFARHPEIDRAQP